MNCFLFFVYIFFARYGIVFTLIVVAAISAASLSPSGSVGDPGKADKTIHVLAYAAAILPVALSRSKRIFLTGLGVIAWSGAIELLQPLVGRGATVADLLANTVGVVLGLCVGYLARWSLRNILSQHQRF